MLVRKDKNDYIQKHSSFYYKNLSSPNVSFFSCYIEPYI